MLIRACIWACILNIIQIFAQDGASCTTKETCSACIQDKGCAWCSQPPSTTASAMPLIRCQSMSITKPGWCPPEFLINPEPKIDIIKNAPLTALKNGDAVQIQPQEVKLTVRRDQEFDLDFYYSQAEDYPVDLYYLMDLSASMADDKDKLEKLGVQLASVMNNITSNFRLGFGSFVDKTEMPFVSTVPDKLKVPCTIKDSRGREVKCAPPYSFKNHLKLTENTDEFTTEVHNAPVSGNLDAPEGGFDAVMQAIVCQNDIGWRPKARHLLVFSTDAASHIAGDGKLAGIVEPNDETCHLNEKGYYTRASDFDYPSVSQINKVAKKNNINVIFAVTSSQENVYKDLKDRITGASFGKLSKDSSNVVGLVRGVYDKLTDSVKITDNAGGIVEVKYYSSCLTSGPPTETNECDGIRVNTPVKFRASIKVISCPANKREWSQNIEIKPGAFNESLLVRLNVICDCPCEQEGNAGFLKQSPACNNLGNLECGVCSCQTDRYGRFCECDKKEVDSGAASGDSQGCKATNATEDICSRHGTCKCGKCKCNERKNPNELYYGAYCECDNFSCGRNGGDLCSNRGTCNCGFCVCNSGWSGTACDCPSTNHTCIRPREKDVCSGRGDCDCGVCKCHASAKEYSGKYCEECPTCKGQRCDELKSCVECQAYKSGKYSEDDCKLYCTDFDTMIVDKIEEKIVDDLDDNTDKDDDEKICRLPDDSSCTIVFKYKYDPANEKLHVVAQKHKECRTEVNLALIAAYVVGSIVIAGIIALLIWKLVTEVYDRREYVKFEKELQNHKWGRGDNPLYKQPTSTFKNPTFEGK